jgi:type IV secretion system protein VirD4
MRWTTIALSILLVCLMAVLWRLVSSYIALLAAVHRTADLTTTIIHLLLYTRITDPIKQTTTWILLVLMGLTVLIARIHIYQPKRTTYGSSHYATWREAWPYLKRSLHWVKMPKRRAKPQPVLPESRFVIGKYRWQTVALTEKQQEEQVMITGSNGAGKSSQLLIPNLLGECGSRSLFIADLKNELFSVTVGTVARSHQVWLFAPTRPGDSHGYNPLAHIRSAADANLFARCWVKNTGESKEPYWASNAQLLITAAVLHLRTAEPDAPFYRLNELLTEQPFEDLEELLSTSPSIAARKKAGVFLDNMKRNERLIGSIMTDIGNRFQVFDSDGVADVTAMNEIDFDVMIDVPTALYLSIPRSETELHQPLLACFTMQMFRSWERRGVLPRGIACYLDEFANLGHIPKFESFISTARYLHVALLIAIQSASQLDGVYGKDAAKTIKNNANTHIVFPGVGLEETKYYSERVGEATIQTESMTERDGASEHSSTQSEAKRPLMTPDEIRTMPKRTVLVIPSSSAPMRVKTTPYFENRSLASLANIPYHLTHVRQSPSFSSQSSQGDTTTTKPPEPIIIDADQDKKDEQDDDRKHFIWESE